VLDVLKVKRRDCSMRTLSGLSSTIPAPTPSGFEEPFTCMVHQVSWGLALEGRWQSLLGTVLE